MWAGSTASACRLRGLRAYEDRHTHPGSGYRIATRPQQLPAELAGPLRASAKAWAYWQAQTPAYRRAAVHWVSSPKRDVTKAQRLEQLIGDCAAHRRLGALTPPATKR